MTDSMRYAWRRMVVRDPRLSDATRRVLLELESYANPDGTNARPGRARLAEVLLTEKGPLSERTVRRALSSGVELGFIECTTKGRQGRSRNSADVYRLTFPAESIGGVVDIQMSTIGAETSGHPDVHQSPSTSGHLETTSGHFGSTSGHLDVHLPVPYTSSSTPEGSSHLSNARESSAAITEEPPTLTPSNPLAWIDNELPGGFRIGERERAQELLDAGTHYGAVRWQILGSRNARPKPGKRRHPLPDTTQENSA